MCFPTMPEYYDTRRWTFLIEEWFPELNWSLKMRSTREKTEK